MCLLTGQPLTTPYSLFAFINDIRNTIKQYSSPIWLIAEISEFKIYNKFVVVENNNWSPINEETMPNSWREKQIKL